MPLIRLSQQAIDELPDLLPTYLPLPYLTVLPKGTVYMCTYHLPPTDLLIYRLRCAAQALPPTT